MRCEKSLHEHLQTTTIWSPLRKIRHQEARLARQDLRGHLDRQVAPHQVEGVEGTAAQAASWQR